MDPYKVDPYGEAMYNITHALTQGLDNVGAMSTRERDILLTIRQLIQELDPTNPS